MSKMHPPEMDREIISIGVLSRNIEGMNLAPKAESRYSISVGGSSTDDDDNEDNDINTRNRRDEKRRPSLPSMKVADEINLMLAAGEQSGAEQANEGEGASNKWWRRKSAQEQDDDNVRTTAVVRHDDSDNCAGNCSSGFHHGEEATQAGIVHRRRSLDNGPRRSGMLRRASIGSFFSSTSAAAAAAAAAEKTLPPVPRPPDAEEIWANTTWATGWMRRISADGAVTDAAREGEQNKHQPKKSATERRASITFGMTSNRAIPSTSDTAAINPPGFLRTISGSNAKERRRSNSDQDRHEEEVERAKAAKAEQDQNLTEMLKMLKAQRASGKKTCTNVANAVIVKEYMEVQRRASVAFGSSTSIKSNGSGDRHNKDDEDAVDKGARNASCGASVRRASIGFTGMLGGFRQQAYQQQQETAVTSSTTEPNYYSYSKMTELEEIGTRSASSPRNELPKADPPMRPRISRRSSMY